MLDNTRVLMPAWTDTVLQRVLFPNGSIDEKDNDHIEFHNVECARTTTESTNNTCHLRHNQKQCEGDIGY